MSIILRKVQGKLAPLMRPTLGSFGGSPGPASVLSFLFSPIVLFAILIAFALAWVMAHGGWSAGHGAFSLATITLTGSLDKQVKDADDMLAEKSKSLHEIFTKAGDDVDFGHKDVLQLTGKKSSQEVVEHVRSLNTELEEIGTKRDEVLSLRKIRDDNQKRRNEPANPLNHGGDEDRSGGRKSVVLKKATFLTTAGWAPESLRVPGLVIEKATRPIQLLDIIPSGPTSMAAVKYMEETTRTEASAERARSRVVRRERVRADRASPRRSARSVPQFRSPTSSSRTSRARRPISKAPGVRQPPAPRCTGPDRRR
jgi:hypothetical protein